VVDRVIQFVEPFRTEVNLVVARRDDSAGNQKLGGGIKIDRKGSGKLPELFDLL